MASLSLDGEQLYKPEHVENDNHGILQDSEELESKIEQCGVSAIPELPSTAAPVLDSTLNSTDTYKSSFANWKKLAFTPTATDTIPDNNEELFEPEVVVIEKQPLPHLETETATDTIPDNSEELFEPEVVVIEKQPLPHLETDRLAEPTSSNDLLMRSMSTEDKYDKIFDIDNFAIKETRPQFPSFRSNTIAAVLGSTEPVQSDFVRLNLPPEEALSEAMMSFLDNQQPQFEMSKLDEQVNHSEEDNEMKEGTLGDLMEVEEDNIHNENDDSHYSDLNHDKELDDVMFFTTNKRKVSTSSAESSDHCVIDMENAVVPVLETEDLRNPDRIEPINQDENILNISATMLAPSQFDEEALVKSNEFVPNSSDDASVPEDSDNGLRHRLRLTLRQAIEEQPPPLQYANLADPVLENNGQTFTIKRNEPPVVYEDLAPETEIDDLNIQNDHAAVHKTRNSPIFAVDTAKDMLASEEEREDSFESEKFDKQNDDSVSDESEEEKETNTSNRNIYDSVALERNTDDIRNGSIGNEKAFEEDGNSYDSVVAEEPEEENEPKFIVASEPITEDWLAELISKPVEAKSDVEPVKPAIPHRRVPKNAQRRTSNNEKKDVLIIEEPSVKVARMNLETKTPILNEESLEIEDIPPVKHGYYNARDSEKQRVYIEDEKRHSIKLEELSESDDTPPSPPPFVLNSPKRSKLDNDTKIYIQTMAREQRERHLLSIADGTVPPGSPIRIEDPMSGKIIEVLPKDFVQVIKEHPIQENEYDYLQGAASALDRYEMPAQRRSQAAPNMSPFPPVPARQPRHLYDEFDQRPNSQPWELPPRPAERTRFSLAPPTNYNHHMHAPPPLYLEDHQETYAGEMQMTKQSGYPFSPMQPQTPTGYPKGISMQHLPPISPLSQSPQEPPVGPYPFYNLSAQTLIQQQQSVTPSIAPSVAAQPQPNIVTVNPAPIPPPRPSGNRRDHQDDVDDYNRHSSDEESGHSQQPRRGHFVKNKGRPRKRPSVDPEVERNRSQQDCMKRNCCCWIVVVTLMVLVVIFAVVGVFVWLHFWDMEPSTTPYMSTTTSAGIRT